MRNPVNTGKSTHKIHFPLRSLTGPRAATRGDGICSFFSAVRRTNQEAPPLLSGFFGRRLAPPSGAAELAALKQSSPSLLGRLASSRPDKGGASEPRHGCLGHAELDASVRSYRAPTRYPGILVYVIPHRDAESREYKQGIEPIDINNEILEKNKYCYCLMVANYYFCCTSGLE